MAETYSMSQFASKDDLIATLKAELAGANRKIARQQKLLDGEQLAAATMNGVLADLGLQKNDYDQWHNVRAESAESRLREAQAWIPVSERLPHAQKMVLMHIPNSHRGPVAYGFLDFETRKFKVGVASSIHWMTCEGQDTVTHWMPLPKPPAARAAEGKKGIAAAEEKPEGGT